MKNNLEDNYIDKNSIAATSEGFIHMSNTTFDKLFGEGSSINLKSKIGDINKEFCENVLSGNYSCKGSDQIYNVNIDTQFNDRCAHGHRKCCIRFEAKIETKAHSAAEILLDVISNAIRLCTKEILQYDLEVQLHRVRLMSIDFSDTDNWVRPDNYDPKKGPRIHGC